MTPDHFRLSEADKTVIGSHDQAAADLPLTFRSVQRMDAIRRENNCIEAICAYEEGCICWHELQRDLRGLPWAEMP